MFEFFSFLGGLCIFGFLGVGGGKGRVVAEEGKEETTERLLLFFVFF